MFTDIPNKPTIHTMYNEYIQYPAPHIHTQYDLIAITQADGFARQKHNTRINSSSTLINSSSTVLSAAPICDRVYLLEQGQIQFEGKMSDLTGDPALCERYLGVV